jgi:hypothetical protein
MAPVRCFTSFPSALLICFLFCGVLAGAPEENVDDVPARPFPDGGEAAVRDAGVDLRPGVGNELGIQDAPDRLAERPPKDLRGDEGRAMEGGKGNVQPRGGRALDAELPVDGMPKPGVPAAAPVDKAPRYVEGRGDVDMGGLKGDGEDIPEDEFVGESPKHVVERIRALSKKSIEKDNSKDSVLHTLLFHVDELERYLLSSDSNPDQPRDAHLANAVNRKDCRVAMAKFHEQSRAFDELLKEKSRLTKMLKEEHARLEEYQRKANSPELGEWLRLRSARLQAYFENPETDAVSYYAKRFVESELSAAQDGLSSLESKLERTVDALLPTRYSSFVAVALTFLITAFPIAVTTRYMHTLSRSISLRQYVFLGNLFLASFAIGVGVLGLVLRQDPLVTLYDSAENMFIFLQLGLAIVYVGILFLLGLTLRGLWHDRAAVVFGSELVFYLAVGYHYHGRIWGPTMLGRPLGTSPALYVMYVVDFCAMVALTISTVEPGKGAVDAEHRLPQHTTRSSVAVPRGVEVGNKGD